MKRGYCEQGQLPSAASCGCCEGVAPLTPLPTVNRPGIPSLAYRVGTHATFLETMKARLSASRYPELSGLTTRGVEDPAVALLDAWATVGDVLTFYQERIANEGYLRTATERRSVLELAQLVGYAPRPGVAATAYLAYTVDENTKGEVLIPRGSRVQSVPDPGQFPQTFETSEDLNARADWSSLKPCLRRPQYVSETTSDSIETLYLKGTVSTKANDRLIFVFFSPFGVNDINVSLIAKLQNELNARPVSVFVWDAFDHNTKQLLVDPKSGSRQKQSVLVQAINTILQGASIYDEARFFGVHLSSETRSLIAQEPTGDSLIYLNQLLLRDAYPNEVRHKAFAIPRRVELAESQFAEGRTKVLFQVFESTKQPRRLADAGVMKPAIMNPVNMNPLDVAGLLIQKTPILLPSSQAYLIRSIPELFGRRSDVNAKLVTAYQPVQKDVFYKVFEALPVTKPSELQSVQVMGIKAGVCGRTAPLKPVIDQNGAMVGSEEWPLESLTLGVVLDPVQSVSIVSVSDREGVRTGSCELAEESHDIDLGSGYKAKVTFHLNVDENVFFSGDFKFSLIETQQDLSITVGRVKREIATFTRLAKGSGEAAHEVNVSFTFRFPVLNGEVVETLLPGRRVRRSSATYRLALAVDSETLSPSVVLELIRPSAADARKVIALDAQYDQITPGSWVIVERPGAIQPETVAKVKAIDTVSKTDYNLPATVTQLTLDRAWLSDQDVLLSDIRDTVIYAQSDSAQPAEEPLTADIAGDLLELGNVVDGLEPGRWLIVNGERTDLKGASGIRAAELAMLAGVTHDVAKAPDGADLSDDKTHTWLRLNNKLAHTYKRGTVTIYANVVKGTHGETRQEVLGSGDGGIALQSFDLKSTPLTYVAAPTPSGAESTLEVQVNDLLWHEAETLAGLTPTDRRYITKTDDEGKAMVQFGNGLSGARLPTGSENVRAVYRSGIGQAGNVRAGQLSLLMMRPSGLKEVINPLPASGGADRETRDSARRNAPLRVMALDRLVSVSDCADFARSFAGIGKAMAMRLSDGRRELVHLTIAGADDVPIDVSSDLYRNLMNALLRFGDPALPVLVAERELLVALIKARVRVKPDYRWNSIEANVRVALLDAFGFDERELGQDLLLSEVIAAIQAVPGVAYVDVDEFDAVSEAQLKNFLDASLNSPDAKDLFSFLRTEREKAGQKEEERPRSRIPVQLARSDDTEAGGVAPAQLAILSPKVEITLILEEIGS